MGQRAGREIVEMAERYPILLSITGLMLGAVAGAALRPTVAEDRYVGPASDALRRRAKQTVSDQLEQVAATADEVISSVEDRLPREEDRQEQAESQTAGEIQSGPASVGHEASEVDSNAVVEGAADADEATASRKEKNGAESRAPLSRDDAQPPIGTRPCTRPVGHASRSHISRGAAPASRCAAAMTCVLDRTVVPQLAGILEGYPRAPDDAGFEREPPAQPLGARGGPDGRQHRSRQGVCADLATGNHRSRPPLSHLSPEME
jgi:hypothetical protein